MNAAPGNTVGYFDEASSGWSAKYQSSSHFRSRLETVLNWLGEGQGRQVLDYGCGSGVFLMALAERGFSITGVDASGGMIEASKVLLGETPHQLEVINPDTFEGTYRQRVYDGVCCMGVLEYVDEDSRLLAMLAPLIKEGGFLALSVPNRGSLLRQVEQFVYRHPGWFRALGLFPHLTGPDSYLNFQKHQYRLAELDGQLASFGLQRQHHRYHVAPGFLMGLENSHVWGMTVIALYKKCPAS